MLKNSKLSERFNRKNLISEPELASFEADAGLQEPDSEKDFQIAENNIGTDVIEKLKTSLIEKINATPVWFDYSGEERKELIKNFINSKENNFNQDDLENLVNDLSDYVNGFGVLENLLGNDKVSAVFVNGTKSIHIEIAAKVLNTEMKLSQGELKFLLNYIFSLSGKNQNIFKYSDDRYNICVMDRSLCKDGEIISIRKRKQFSLEELIDKDFITKDVFDFIVSAVNSRKNIVISAPVNCGKTALLNLIANCLLKEKRTAFIGEDCDVEGAGLMKFRFSPLNPDYDAVMTNVVKMMPEYLITDFNSVPVEISGLSGVISTLRAAGPGNALAEITAAFMARENLPEKLAKAKVLKSYDYIIQLNKTDDGTLRLTSVTKLVPAKTASASVKTVIKYCDGQYHCEI